MRELTTAGGAAPTAATAFAAVCDASSAAGKPPPSPGAVYAALHRARHPLHAALPSRLPCQLVFLKLFEDHPTLMLCCTGYKLAGAAAELRDVGQAGKTLSLLRDDWFISLALPATLSRIHSQRPLYIMTDTKHALVAQLRDHGAIVIAYAHDDGHTDLASITLVSSKENRLMTVAAHLTQSAMRTAAADSGAPEGDSYCGPTHHIMDMAPGEGEAVRAAIPTIGHSDYCVFHVLQAFSNELKEPIVADPSLVAISPLLKRRRGSGGAGSAAVSGGDAGVGGGAAAAVASAASATSLSGTSASAVTSAVARDGASASADVIQQQRKSLMAALAALVTVADRDVFVVLTLGIISRHHVDPSVMMLLCREPYNRLAEIAAANRALLNGAPATNDGVEAHNRVLGHDGEKMVHVGGLVVRLLHDLVYNEQRAAARLAAAALRRARLADLHAMAPLASPHAVEVRRRASTAAKAAARAEKFRSIARGGHSLGAAAHSAAPSMSAAAVTAACAAPAEARGVPVSLHPPMREAACVAEMRRTLSSSRPVVDSLVTLAAAGASEVMRPQPGGRGVRHALFAAVAPASRGAAASLQSFCAKHGISQELTFTSIIAAWRMGFRVTASSKNAAVYDAAVAAAAGASPPPSVVHVGGGERSGFIAGCRAKPASGSTSSRATNAAVSAMLDLASVGDVDSGSNGVAADIASTEGSGVFGGVPAISASLPPAHLAVPAFSTLPPYVPYVASRGAQCRDAALLRSCVFAESEREYPPSFAAEMRRLGALPAALRVAAAGTVFGYRPVDLSTQAPPGRPPVRVTRADKEAAAASLIAVEALGGAGDAERKGYTPHEKKKRGRPRKVAIGDPTSTTE